MSSILKRDIIVIGLLLSKKYPETIMLNLEGLKNVVLCQIYIRLIKKKTFAFK